MAQTPRAQALPFPPLCPGTAESQATQGTGATQEKLQPKAAVQNEMKSWIKKKKKKPRSFIRALDLSPFLRSNRSCKSLRLCSPLSSSKV